MSCLAQIKKHRSKRRKFMDRLPHISIISQRSKGGQTKKFKDQIKIKACVNKPNIPFPTMEAELQKPSARKV